jgi:hypothetical protein
MARPRKHPLRFNPDTAIRTYTQEYTRPNGEVVTHTFFVFPCVNKCGNEVSLRSGGLGDKRVSGRCRECSNKNLAQLMKLRPFEALYHSLRQTNREVELTYEDFLEFTEVSVCHYCEAGIGWVPFSPSRRSKGACNLDRKDNEIGYLKSNCVVCCWRCNLVKGNVLTYEQMMRLSPILREFTKENGGRPVYDPKNRWRGHKPRISDDEGAIIEAETDKTEVA